MDLSEIAAEIEARGFHHIQTSRIKQWVNQRYRRTNTAQAWPFLEATATGTAPLAITDFRAALSVIDTTNRNPITFDDIRTIREDDPTLIAGGTPAVWYRDGGEINVYPVSAVDLDVRYLLRPSDLADGDSPLWPEEYHYLLVEGGVADAYRNTDNFEAAGQLETLYAEGIMTMTEDLMVPNYDTARSMVVYDMGGWY